MKKNIVTVFALVGAILLTGCNNAVDPSKDRIIPFDTISQSADGQSVVKTPGMHLFFKANSDIPYFSVRDTASFLESFRKTSVGQDAYFKYYEDGDKATIVNDSNDKVTFDPTKQTITFSDFDSFNSTLYKSSQTLEILKQGTIPFINCEDTTYTKGNEYVIDLSPYSKLDIYQYKNDYYIPFSLFSDLFVNIYSFVNIVYSFDSLFFFPTNTVFYYEDVFGNKTLTPIGEAYFDSKENNPVVSKEYAEYYYQTICLNFDYLYGVKELAGRNYTTFDEYLSTSGYKEDLLSGDVHKMDNAYCTMLTYLNDFHTAFALSSPLYKFDTLNVDVRGFNPAKTALEENEEALRAMRRITRTEPGFSVDARKGVAYITFDKFDSLDVATLQKGNWTIEEYLSNCGTLFAYAYKEITTRYLNSVNYVIVDIATNDGGSADSMLFILGVILGNMSIETQNPFTGGHTKTNYKFDINLDGVIDEKDISLREYGKKIAFVDTCHSFSCGNAFPVFAKNNYPDDVTIIGETTGGGTCVVRHAFTTLGSQYSISGLMMLSKRDENNNLVNIEDGIIPDIPLDRSLTINKNIVINTLLYDL